MKKLISLIFVLLLVGCATGDMPSKCDIIAPGDSILCDMAQERGIRIEDVGNAFIVVNAIAIGEGLYTREEAISVCEGLSEVLDDPITYIAFHAALSDRLDRYPGLLVVAMSYLNMFNLDIEMYAQDRALLVNWLDNRIISLGG